MEAARPRLCGSDGSGPVHHHRRESTTMAKKDPWHSVKQTVHHNNTGCNTGNNIERENLRSGTGGKPLRSEEHTSELQSLMRISYAVFCLKKKNQTKTTKRHIRHTQQ